MEVDVHRSAVDNLVKQFSSALHCLRELVQNSIDAGSPTVDVWMEFEPGDGHQGTISIHVDDFGEGMDENISKLDPQKFEAMIETAVEAYPNFQAVATTLRKLGQAVSARLMRHAYMLAAANLHVLLEYPLPTSQQTEAGRFAALVQ